VDILYTFGFKLAELARHNDVAGIDLLCLAIKDASRSMQRMGYRDFKSMFRSQLPRRREKTKAADRDRVMLALLNCLNQRQSPFTAQRH